ncbi:MAG: hypothetical protein C4547_06300 [Phycisphaerales bacterium]|nr:MAG: hypothetical protein C4547_06300 [Phycisphaerales bacterium]
MSDRIRFPLDENVDPDVAHGLRRYGIDVSTTVASGLRTASDEVQLAFARNEQRVLVTHDVDFLDPHISGTDHPGIAFCKKTDRTVGQIIRQLILVYEVLTPGELAGQVEYL